METEVWSDTRPMCRLLPIYDLSPVLKWLTWLLRVAERAGTQLSSAPVSLSALAPWTGSMSTASQNITYFLLPAAF
jgi:hypothetical protein